MLDLVGGSGVDLNKVVDHEELVGEVHRLAGDDLVWLLVHLGPHEDDGRGAGELVDLVVPRLNRVERILVRHREAQQEHICGFICDRT